MFWGYKTGMSTLTETSQEGNNMRSYDDLMKTRKENSKLINRAKELTAFGQAKIEMIAELRDEIKRIDLEITDNYPDKTIKIGQCKGCDGYHMPKTGCK